MKATKLLIVAALFTGLTTLSIAGPGAQYWAQRTADAKAEKAKQTQTQTQPKSDEVAKACTTCSCCADTKKS